MKMKEMEFAIVFMHETEELMENRLTEKEMKMKEMKTKMKEMEINMTEMQETIMNMTNKDSDRDRKRGRFSGVPYKEG